MRNTKKKIYCVFFSSLKWSTAFLHFRKNQIYDHSFERTSFDSLAQMNHNKSYLKSYSLFNSFQIEWTKNEEAEARKKDRRLSEKRETCSHCRFVNRSKIQNRQMNENWELFRHTLNLLISLAVSTITSWWLVNDDTIFGDYISNENLSFPLVCVCVPMIIL